VLVISWFLEREYRQHRMLDDELPATYAKWLAHLDGRLQREVGETRERVVKVVIHPGEIEIWARHQGRPVNERTRLDYAALMWSKEARRPAAGDSKAPIGALVKNRRHDPRPRAIGSDRQADTR
jgi:hypothetical protein